MDTRHRSINVLSVFLILVGLVWFVVAGYGLSQTSVALNIRIIISALIFADGIFYLLAAWGVTKKIRWIVFLAIPLTLLNAIASFADEVGMYDILSFVVNAGIFVLLMVNYKKIN